MLRLDWNSIKASPNVPEVDPVTIMLIQIKTRVARIEATLTTLGEQD